MGPIPRELFKLANLTDLDLSSNSLSGPLPPEIGKLTSLTSLDLSNNSLSGPLPPEISKLTSLSDVRFENNGIYGPIPRGLGNLTKLEWLSLYDNKVSGPIPPEIGKLTKLTYLFLDNNNLSGPIPAEMAHLTSLTSLGISNNSLSGPIPLELGNMKNLSLLGIYNNKLSGPIPSQLGSLTNLGATLDLSSNRLSGRIPSELANLLKLKWLYLSDNLLSGAIPRELVNLTRLQLLDLSSNKLSGPIPSELGGLKKMVALHLHDNYFSGRIPPELGNLPELNYLDVSNNSLAGPIPPEFSNLSNLYHLFLARNQLSGPIPNLSQVRELDLTHNILSQPIPNGILSSNLTVLKLDDLAPSSLSDLPHLVTVSLGKNQSVSKLDLSGAPPSCRLVEWMGSGPSEILFWDACTGKSTGCAIDLTHASSKPKLSRSTKRGACLGKVSIFLQGEPPTLETETFQDAKGTFVRSQYLANKYGNYFLNSSSFLSEVYLGPFGLTYTGVGVTRVRNGNLCGNPEAKRVAVAAYGAFATALAAATAVIWIGARWRRRVKGSGAVDYGAGWYLAVLEYFWRVVSSIVPVLDFVTDCLVLSDVWGAWPMWVILGSILAPIAVAALLMARSWTWPCKFRFRDVRLRWLWRPVEVARKSVDPGEGGTRAWLTTAALWPLAVMGVLFQDALAFLDKLGVHVAAATGRCSSGATTTPG